MTDHFESHEVHRYLVTILDRTYTAACELERKMRFGSVRFDGSEYTAHMAEGNRVLAAKFWVAKRPEGLSRINGTCSCQNLTCLHAEAAFVHYVLEKHSAQLQGVGTEQDSAIRLSALALEWLDTVKTAQRAVTMTKLPRSTQEPERTLFYVLDAARGTIRLTSSKRLKRGGYSKTFREESGWMSFSNSGRYHSAPVVPAIFSSEDVRLARLLYIEGVLPITGGPLSLNRLDPEKMLLPFAQTGRLIDTDGGGTSPISVGSTLPISCAWAFNEQSETWSLVAEFAGRNGVEMLPTEPVWYYDRRSSLIGPISNVLAPTVQALVRQKRQLRSKDLPEVHRILSSMGGIQDLPPLPEIKTNDLGIFRPIPTLSFALEKSSLPYAFGRINPLSSAKIAVTFNYQGRQISPVSVDRKIVFYQGSHQTIIERDMAFEERCVQGFSERYRPAIAKSGEYIFAGERGDYGAEVLDFQSLVVPKLIKDGWKIEYSPEFDIRIADATEWTLNFDEVESGWYKLRLDASANGQNIDLIDVLRRMLNDPAFEKDVLSGDIEEKVWWSRLPTGEYIKIDVARVRRLARLLIDIGRGADANKPLKISRFDVGILSGLDADSQLIVHGAEHLFDLAKALSRPPEPLPDSITEALILPLRPYQRDGVAWLRSLLALGVGCLLSDEMAVGKTIQTLVHLWGEVENSINPSLIVVPMTLMTKWIEERDKFIPSLSIHQYYGNSRKGTLQSARCSHVVLTTYQLLARDINEFVACEWHIVACDEGHELRNSKAEFSRAVKALTAKQKVVITGTPLQNKPEDMWSVMDIAVPGLLRDKAWFRARFVTDSQKDEQIASRCLNLLGQITAPFRLARKNTELGNALPKVNEVIRYVDIGDEQREIYEVVRATVDFNVRSLIAEKGLAKNQITVLAAITKLRQICCHPALVKSGEVPPDTPSAKLDLLMEMADELQAEGKWVVIVSEWVEVLKIVAQRLDQASMPHRMLVGTMTRTKRDESIAAFRSGRVRFLLMTLGVGGLGLDLPEGDVIIVLEPWWNPARIRQAIARLQRDDRDKQISAIHLIAKGTLEEGVMRIAAKKGEMIEAVMGGSSGSLGSIDREDIEMLFSARR